MTIRNLMITLIQTGGAMVSKSQLLIIGIGGSVLGVDPATGTEVWRTKLKGGDFVTVSTIGSQIFAGAKGELFCLDAASGRVLWRNQLKGLGAGIVSFTSTSDVVVIAAHEAQKTAAAAAAAAAAT
jgi:outer membrane protein assembly factor BamB